MLTLLFVAGIMMAIAAILIGASTVEPQAPEAEKRFQEVLETPHDETWLNQRKWRQARSITQKVKRLLERMPGTDMGEIEVLLRQAALNEERHRAMVYTSLWLLPATGAVLGLLASVTKGYAPATAMSAGFAAGFILPRKGLRWVAARRQREIKEEMPVVLNLMRLLFDAGLSLEHTLKAISEQARDITPHLANEFSWALIRIQHGQDRGEALDELAKRNDVHELTETVAMLKQAARYGGNLRESLLRYLHLMEDRRMTDLKDKVGKMSAKMSIVMVAFLFPALLIFLAGPGVIAVGKAFAAVR
ncbi:MAG: hypothetical protein RI907_3768 [Pseudomonadota bacterium]|jgi:tight adherence protein C